MEMSGLIQDASTFELFITFLKVMCEYKTQVLTNKMQKWKKRNEKTSYRNFFPVLIDFRIVYFIYRDFVRPLSMDSY